MGQVSACSVPADVDSHSLNIKPKRVRRAAAVADLFGILEISGSTAVGATTRLAMAEAVAAVAQRGCQGAGLGVEVARCPANASGVLRFSYSLRGGASTVAGARSNLQREAAEGGTSRLLPCFVHALKAHGEQLQRDALAKLVVTEWTLNSADEITAQELLNLGGVASPDKTKDAPLLFAVCSAEAPAGAGTSAAPSPTWYPAEKDSEPDPHDLEVVLQDVVMETRFPWNVDKGCAWNDDNEMKPKEVCSSKNPKSGRRFDGESQTVHEL